MLIYKSKPVMQIFACTVNSCGNYFVYKRFEYLDKLMTQLLFLIQYTECSLLKCVKENLIKR